MCNFNQSPARGSAKDPETIVPELNRLSESRIRIDIIAGPLSKSNIILSPAAVGRDQRKWRWSAHYDGSAIFI